MPTADDRITRRRFVGAAAGTLGAAALGGPAAALAKPHRRTPFDHVVVLMMENRSFDHFLGWVPGADGRQAGLVYRDAAGVPHATHALAPDYQGCGFADPDHSYLGGRVEYNGGRCDGWLRAGRNDVYSIGYYRRKDLSFFGPAVKSWTTFSRYFSGILAETYPNRFVQHAGQTDRLANNFSVSTLPTIWDRLAGAGLSGRYYFSDLPFLALWGGKYTSISHPIADFFKDCAAGTLPHVSYVDPTFLGEEAGTSADDHPHADIRNGEAFMNRIYRAVTTSPAWSRTALVINYDEWGGFFDHVPPPTRPLPPATRAAGDVDGRLGFRVPCLLVSPYARRGYVGRRQYDHTSILRMIEDRFNLAPLTVRDATANNLADELLPRAKRWTPQFDVPAGPFGGACPVPAPGDGDLTATRSAVGAARRGAARGSAEERDWDRLRELAQSTGWPV